MMSHEPSQRVIQFDPELILRMKYLGLSKSAIAGYYGMRYSDFIKKLNEQPMLRELLK